MRTALTAFGLFTTGFVVHWLVWRVRIPLRQTASLLGIFAVTLVVGLAVLTSPAAEAFGCRLGSPWEVLHVAEFHVAAMLAYVVAYSAIEERSPSMTILTAVADSGPGGLRRADVEGCLRGLAPLERRIDALVRDGMVDRSGDDLRITAKGRQWAATFGATRRVLGMTKGG
ncbi:MAG: hypothetical protein KGQ61_00835 [Planctomycetes bacterium]|nr:hypothetical protein [Planctomycetota bacterium]